MKRLFSLFALLAFCGSSAFAGLKTPDLTSGRQLAPTEAPCTPYQLGYSTGTTEQVLSTTPGWVSWLAVSTGAATGYAVLRDSGAAAGNMITEIGPRAMFITSAAQLFNFAPGLRFNTGLTGQVVGGNGAGLATQATVCYRKDNTATQ